jgi:hypothetical protein
MLIGLVNQSEEIIFRAVSQKRFMIEGRFSWLAFPGLIKALAMLQGVFFLVLIFNPKAGEIIYPNMDKVMSGQIWRLFSWVLYPPYPPSPGGSLVFPFFFTLIVLRIFFLFDETLELAWGSTRTSLYLYATIICQGLALNFFPFLFDGKVYYFAIFFAFATIQPHYTFLLMFFLPVKVWIFAVLAGVGIAIISIESWVKTGIPILLVLHLFLYLPYLVWAIPKAWKWRKTRHQVTARRNKFQSTRIGKDTSLHRCKNCDRTENSDPDLQFRVAEDDEEYCLDHLP